jgi:acylphosphatase
VRQEAKARGVRGWVRNCSDGTVEAAFEGDPDAVDAMVEFCRAGPGAASVSSLDVASEDVEGEPGFSVR